jgi:exopolysaccharide biosynthesis WecB/TagA/CpsF family protein
MLAEAHGAKIDSGEPDAARVIGHVAIEPLGHDAATVRIAAAAESQGHLKVAFANAHVVNLAATDTRFRAALAHCLVLPDGIGVDIGSRLLFGAPFPCNLNGTDFTPALLKAMPRALNIALIGAMPGVAERAAGRLAEIAPRHRFGVVSDGYFGPEREADILAHLRAQRPDLLLVAFGNPGQEIWIAEKLDRSHCAVAMGVGALFDFLAQETPRAPAWLRRWRLEWLYRLWIEPGRLWRRYVLGNPAFLVRVLGQRLRGHA